jgi:hypothetical protein
MRAARLQELEEIAEKLLATARELSPGQEHHNALREIGRFRVQIAALKGADLRRPQRRLKKKMSATRRSWTDVEIRRLKLLADEKNSVDHIAKSLERSVASINLKAYWLNLSLGRRPKAKGK